MGKASWISVAVGLCSALWAVPSWAGEPATSNTLQLGLGFRYGVELNEGDLNPWGTGIGLEVGYTLPLIPIYVGGNAEYFFGGTLESPLGDVDSKIWQLSVEGGYDIGVGDHFVIRPKLGLGYAFVNTETCFVVGECESESDGKPLIAPGAKFLLILPKFQLAFDARYAMVTSDPVAKAFIFSVGIGF
jgi:hypothetical protein